MAFKALIFDFDGVITDTEPVHMEAWQGVLEPLGIEFGEEEYRAHYIGLNDRDFLDAVGHIHSRYFDDVEKARLIEVKLVSSMSLLGQDIPLIDGVADFVEAESKRRLFAICSGAQRGEIEFILRHLKWASLFDPVIASDSVKRGKPDAEGYIRAIEALTERATDMILPQEMLAIEDSPKGIAAAHAAGIKCLAIQGTFGTGDISSADWVALSLADVNIDDLIGLDHY
ncbi:MAG: HAD family phosphatase [Pseudomonadota bacterium]